MEKSKNIKRLKRLKILFLCSVFLAFVSFGNASALYDVIKDTVHEVVLSITEVVTDIFSGTLYQRNTDTTFAEITTGTAYEISEITAADPAVATFAGGAELVTNGDIEAATPTMNGVNLAYFAATGGQDAGQAHGGTSSLKVTSTGQYSNARFLDGSNCGLISGTWYKASCWVYLPSGQTCSELSMTYRVAGGGGETELDDTTTTDAWVNLVGYYQGYDPDRVFQVTGNGIVATEFFYVDDISIVPLHSFDTNDVVVISGVASDERLGAELSTGSVVDTNYYIITATQVNHFYTGCAIDDIFLGSEAVISQALDSNNKVKLILPTQAKPYRITSIDSEGVCTIGGADFSDMATAITGAYASEASFTNYTVSALGWMPGTDVDPTPINSGTLTLGEVYFVTALGTPDTFGSGILLYDFFTSAGDETADATNTVLHGTDTYATCDGTQSGPTTLLSDEFWVLNNWGYYFETNIFSIAAGGITPVAGTGLGAEVITSGIDTQDVRGLTTNEYAGLSASVGVTSAKITELTISRYRDLWGQWGIWGDQ